MSSKLILIILNYAISSRCIFSKTQCTAFSYIHVISRLFNLQEKAGFIQSTALSSSSANTCPSLDNYRSWSLFLYVKHCTKQYTNLLCMDAVSSH